MKKLILIPKWTSENMTTSAPRRYWHVKSMGLDSTEPKTSYKIQNAPVGYLKAEIRKGPF